MQRIGEKEDEAEVRTFADRLGCDGKRYDFRQTIENEQRCNERLRRDVGP